jgi:hypothetical protein
MSYQSDLPETFCEKYAISKLQNILCGNKIPTRCIRRIFYCRSYCLLNMFRGPLCPSSGALEYYKSGCCLSYLVFGFQVVGTVWSWGLCVRFAGCCCVSWTNVSALEGLDRRLNKLRNVDINILIALPKLSTMYLFGNLLKCDCQLQEVWRWCEDRNIQTVYWGTWPKCDTPREVEGIWWGVLEKGQCLEGNIMENTTVQATVKMTLRITCSITNMMLILSSSTKYQYLYFPLYLVQSAMSSFWSLSYATRTCELFPICTSLTLWRRNFLLYLVQSAMLSFWSLSYATRTCELFPICTSLT